MVTEKLTITDSAWTTISISGSSVMLQGAGGGLLVAVGTSAPTADDEAFDVPGHTCLAGFSLDGLSSSDNVYVKNVTSKLRPLVALH